MEGLEPASCPHLGLENLCLMAGKVLTQNILYCSLPVLGALAHTGLAGRRHPAQALGQGQA